MKSAICLLALLAITTGNPAANTEWRWKSMMPTVTPNVLAAPFPDAFIPKAKVERVPGHWRADNCGPVSQSKIVDGEVATAHSFPWQVGIFIDGSGFCGGSLISDEWVLTAAHCTTGASSIEVVMGAQDISAFEATQVSMVSTDIITHESYGPVLLVNDVGLVHLPSPVTFTSAIQPVCLPGYSTSDLGAGETVTASGWGKLSDDTVFIADELHEVTTTTISNSACAAVYGSTITSASICTDATNGGTCNGDSGGPLNYVSGGMTYTRGVTSFVSSAGCQSGYPDGFTRVTHYLDWIESHTGIAIDS